MKWLKSSKLNFIPIAITLIGTLVLFQNCSQSKRFKPSDVSTQWGGEGSNQSTNYSLESLITKGDPHLVNAQAIYQQITGVTLSLNNQLIVDMSILISQNNHREAVRLAVDSDDFINVTARDVADKMAVKAGDTIDTLNDFVATFMGTVKEGRDARELLTGNAYYRAKGVAGVSDNVIEHIVKSNTHYSQLDRSTMNVAARLQREEGQKILTQAGTLATLDDAAGLLTTRGFMAAHAKAGTNRRLVEYTFKMFLCSPIETWASTQRTDKFIGRDVPRKPAEEYNNKCKGCHAAMDALRPATAHYDFIETASTAFIAYGYKYTMDPNAKDPTQLNVAVPAQEQYVPYKFRRSAEVYPSGYKVTGNTWTNLTSAEMFGWSSKGAESGSGMKDFGGLIASSEQFPVCMSQRFFEMICRKAYSDKHKPLMESLAKSFKYYSYDMKKLAIEIAMRKDCFGLGN